MRRKSAALIVNAMDLISPRIVLILYMTGLNQGVLRLRLGDLITSSISVGARHSNLLLRILFSNRTSSQSEWAHHRNRERVQSADQRYAPVYSTAFCNPLKADTVRAPERAKYWYLSHDFARPADIGLLSITSGNLRRSVHQPVFLKSSYYGL